MLKDPSELGGAELLDYVQIGVPGRRAKLVPVTDDSLAPRLIVGDMVAIDPDNRSPKRGQVTLFRSSVDGEFFLRRFQPLAHPDFEAVDAKGAAMIQSVTGLRSWGQLRNEAVRFVNDGGGMNESIGVFAIGEAFGSFALMALVSVVVLFINRSRKENPTPYIAAGMICFLLAAMTAMSDRAAPHLSALYVTWLILLWRYKKESNKQASRLGRANAIWLGLVLVICGLVTCGVWR